MAVGSTGRKSLTERSGVHRNLDLRDTGRHRHGALSLGGANVPASTQSVGKPNAQGGVYAIASSTDASIPVTGSGTYAGFPAINGLQYSSLWALGIAPLRSQSMPGEIPGN